jgi:16S rRNA (cytosine1402-N4)-methyltransferase
MPSNLTTLCQPASSQGTTPVLPRSAPWGLQRRLRAWHQLGGRLLLGLSVGTDGGLGSKSWMDEGRGSGAAPEEPEAPLSFYHDPILKDEIVKLLQVGPGKLVMDATLGGGGHSEAFAEAGAHVIGVDQDPGALAHAKQRMRRFEGRFVALRGNFRTFPSLLTEIGVGKLDAILADVGISSRQLDDPAKGFSFMHDGPLDLRMNPDAPLSAADVIATYSVEQLEQILRELGEEPQARRIARALVEARGRKAIRTTLELAAAIERVVPRKGHKHPATLTFQALRIHVNDELGALEDLLQHAPEWLKPGGRIAIISFHSLEDRIVKQAFARYSAPTIDAPNFPAPKPNPEHCLRLITKKPVEPSAEEISRNPRSRSAKLRVAERI